MTRNGLCSSRTWRSRGGVGGSKPGTTATASRTAPPPAAKAAQHRRGVMEAIDRCHRWTRADGQASSLKQTGTVTVPQMGAKGTVTGS